MSEYGPYHLLGRCSSCDRMALYEARVTWSVFDVQLCAECAAEERALGDVISIRTGAR